MQDFVLIGNSWVNVNHIVAVHRASPVAKIYEILVTQGAPLTFDGDSASGQELLAILATRRITLPTV